MVETARACVYFNLYPRHPERVDCFRQHDWLQAFGLAFHSTDSAGYASRGEINDLVSTISPRLLMPVHSFHLLECKGEVGLADPAAIILLKVKGDLS